MAIAKVIYKSDANDSGTVWIDTTQKTVTSGTMLSGQTALKNDGTDITGNIATKTSADMTVSGAAVTAPAGYYASQATKSVSSGTAGTPTASKGTVSNHSVSVTPSVTNTAGYISGGTKTGTAVTVSASELVSGSQEVTENGTVDVTNLAEVVVNVASTPESIVPDSAFADYKTHIGYYFGSDSGTQAYTAYIGVKPTSATGTTINWGDGTTTTTDTTDYKIYSHTYSTAPSDGYYMWTLTAVSGTSYRLDSGSSGYESQYRAYGDSTDPIYMANSSRIRWVTLGAGYNFGTITYSVFQECAGLEEVWLQHSATQYGFVATRYSMFKNVPKLRRVEFKTPNRFGGMSVYQSSFEGCGSLTSFDVTSITNTATRSFQSYAFKNCVNLREFKTILTANHTFGEGVFQNCYKLERIDFTSGSLNIYALAFNNCASLSEMHFHSTTPPTVANINAWDGIQTTCKIYVPTGYLSAYQSATNMPDPTVYTYIEE